MNSFPLKKGQTYKELPNGEVVAVEPPADVATPPADAVETPSEPAATPNAAPAVEDNNVKATKILDEIQSKLIENFNKVEAMKESLPLPTEEDKYKFVRALLANTPFQKEYSLFGGKMKVVFKTITAAEAEAVTEAIVIQSGRVPYTNLLAMSAAHMKYAMTCALVSITTESEDGISIKHFESPFKKYDDTPRKDTYYVKEDGQLKLKSSLIAPAPGQKVIWAAVDSFTDIQIPIYNILFKCFQQFDGLVAEIAKEAAEPDFFLNGAAGS
jgi:hypothetical protein